MVARKRRTARTTEPSEQAYGVQLAIASLLVHVLGWTEDEAERGLRRLFRYLGPEPESSVRTGRG
jgi:hypothetical protein